MANSVIKVLYFKWPKLFIKHLTVRRYTVWYELTFKVPMFSSSFPRASLGDKYNRCRWELVQMTSDNANVKNILLWEMINSHRRYKTDQFKYSNKLFTSSDIVNALESAQIPSEHIQSCFILFHICILVHCNLNLKFQYIPQSH